VGSLRDAARTVYHLPDSLLHPVRRRRVERALRRGEIPGKVLFVCLGNICRSPYAEKALEQALPDAAAATEVVSAGFIGPDRPSPAAARQVAEGHGLDLSEHRSQPLSDELLDASDLIFVMDRVQQRALRRRTDRDDVFVLGDLDPVWAGRRTIRDPVEQPPEVFEEVYGRIDRIVERLAAVLDRDAGRSGGATSG
jgi:protein-tyrosine phosphatase